MMMLRRKTDPKTEAHLVRACAVEMNMDMSQEAFCAEICRENAKHFRYHLD